LNGDCLAFALKPRRCPKLAGILASEKLLVQPMANAGGGMTVTSLVALSEASFVPVLRAMKYQWLTLG
jgi:hypothetical protein